MFAEFARASANKLTDMSFKFNEEPSVAEFWLPSVTLIVRTAFGTAVRLNVIDLVVELPSTSITVKFQVSVPGLSETMLVKSMVKEVSLIVVSHNVQFNGAVAG